MRTFKYFGLDRVAGAHEAAEPDRCSTLAQWLYDNGKIPTLPDTAKWENVGFLPQSLRWPRPPQ